MFSEIDAEGRDALQVTDRGAVVVVATMSGPGDDKDRGCGCRFKERSFPRGGL
jgi:hypothetical protein